MSGARKRWKERERESEKKCIIDEGKSHRKSIAFIHGIHKIHLFVGSPGFFVVGENAWNRRIEIGNVDKN